MDFDCKIEMIESVLKHAVDDHFLHKISNSYKVLSTDTKARYLDEVISLERIAAYHNIDKIFSAINYSIDYSKEMYKTFDLHRENLLMSCLEEINFESFIDIEGILKKIVKERFDFVLLPITGFPLELLPELKSQNILYFYIKNLHDKMVFLKKHTFYTWSSPIECSSFYDYKSNSVSVAAQQLFGFYKNSSIKILGIDFKKPVFDIKVEAWQEKIFELSTQNGFNKILDF